MLSLQFKDVIVPGKLFQNGHERILGELILKDMIDHVWIAVRIEEGNLKLMKFRYWCYMVEANSINDL